MKYEINIKYIITVLYLHKIKRETAYHLLINLDRDISSLTDLIEYLIEYCNKQILSELSVSDFNNALQKAITIINDSKLQDMQMVSILDDNYPPLLKTCQDPPIVLNYIGEISLLSIKPTIAIVGTRTPSVFGLNYSKYVAGFFAARGFNVISGLAKGCDTAAHFGALDAKGATSAVLAHGLDVIYPKENESLAERIKKNGVIVSEYFIGTSVTRKHFIDRDRVQAALALGVFIIECDVKSGTMHTANYALAYNKILICMKPPIEHFKDTKVAGNQMLSRAGKAMPIYNDSELEELAMILQKQFDELL